MLPGKNKKYRRFVLFGLSVAIILGLALGLPMQTAARDGWKCFCPYFKSAQHGGVGGNAFSDDLTQVKSITQIVVRSGSFVDAIAVTYLLTSGETITVSHGGSGGSPSIIQLREGEYIMRIDGRAGDFVDQIVFRTNMGAIFGPFGGNGGNPFSIRDIQVGGFFGRSGDFIDAIGVFTANREK
ncbi:MAG TPA: jacalin-like lectin [Candidatus Deferrimicrobium sp.]|nr:jacalin-like lectin [Candidatus Deferrimicrobium sp.]